MAAAVIAGIRLAVWSWLFIGRAGLAFVDTGLLRQSCGRPQVGRFASVGCRWGGVGRILLFRDEPLVEFRDGVHTVRG